MCALGRKYGSSETGSDGETTELFEAKRAMAVDLQQPADGSVSMNVIFNLPQLVINYRVQKSRE